MLLQRGVDVDMRARMYSLQGLQLAGLAKGNFIIDIATAIQPSWPGRPAVVEYHAMDLGCWLPGSRAKSGIFCVEGYVRPWELRKPKAMGAG